MTKKKIAILGSGMGSLGAALELTSHDGWDNDYEITLYQLGWRLGGKTATGRGPMDRIEEHGIHILQGWYHNLFRMLLSVYEERRDADLDPDSPFPELWDALERNDTTLITEWFADRRRWENWPMIFPETKGLPGEGPPLTTWQLIKKGIGVILEVMLGSPYRENIGPIAKWILDKFFPQYPPPDEEALTAEDHAHPSHQRWFSHLVDDAGKVVDGVEDKLLDAAQKVLGHGDSDEHAEGGFHPIHTVIRLLESAVEYLWKVFEGIEKAAWALHDQLRRILIVAELGFVNLKGIISDVWDPITGKFNYRAINKYDYREWIKSYGANELVLTSGLVKFFYNGTFSNLDTLSDDGGRQAAGTSLRFVVTSIGYKGSFVFQMKAGTGDVVIMPIYQVLKHRGVNFKFFHEVEDIAWSDTGNIEEVTIGRQVDLTVDEYDPRYPIDMTNPMTGDPCTVQAWPSHPIWDQIDPEQAKALREGDIDLESPWADWTNVDTKTLTKGTDFDYVISGIPIGALKDVAPTIFDNDDRWKAMGDAIRTTATQSVQLWIRPTLAELGFVPNEWGLPDQAGAVNAVVYANPMYSWVDESLVLPWETWPDDNEPNVVTYHTGILRDPAEIPPYSDHGYPKQMKARVKAQMRQWLWDNMGWFFPEGTTLEVPAGLSEKHLVGYDKDADPVEAFDDQYFRANVRPTARYTLAWPGSEQYRLRAGESGFDNLMLCGDWIDYGMNVGYIEGAWVSGMQAGQALRERLGLANAKAIWAEPDVVDWD